MKPDFSLIQDFMSGASYRLIDKWSKLLVFPMTRIFAPDDGGGGESSSLAAIAHLSLLFLPGRVEQAFSFKFLLLFHVPVFHIHSLTINLLVHSLNARRKWWCFSVRGSSCLAPKATRYSRSWANERERRSQLLHFDVYTRWNGCLQLFSIPVGMALMMAMAYLYSIRLPILFTNWNPSFFFFFTSPGFVSSSSVSLFYGSFYGFIYQFRDRTFIAILQFGPIMQDNSAFYIRIQINPVFIQTSYFNYFQFFLKTKLNPNQRLKTWF